MKSVLVIPEHLQTRLALGGNVIIAVVALDEAVGRRSPLRSKDHGEALRHASYNQLNKADSHKSDRSIRKYIEMVKESFLPEEYKTPSKV